MKKIVSLALVLVGLSFSGFAQDGKGKVRNGRKYLGTKETVQKAPEEMAKHRVDKLAKELKLTDVQQKEMYSLQLKEIKTQQKYKEEIAKVHEKQRAQKKASRTKFQDLLTAEQRELLKDKYANKEKREYRRGDNRRKGERSEFRKERKNIEKKAEVQPAINS